MAYRKSSAPLVRDGAHGDDGPLLGALAWALDHVTTEVALARWARRADERCTHEFEALKG